MRLTRYTDYALRVLIYLAVRDAGRATIQEIAERYDVSRNHLMKVVQHLGRLGYVETVRGKGGGLRLAKPAEDIRLGELVDHMEAGRTLVECFDPANNACVITPSCRLKFILSEAADAFTESLNHYTLADMMTSRGQLLQDLGFPESAAS